MGRRVLTGVLAAAIGCLVAAMLGEIAVRVFGRAFHRIQVVASHPTKGWAGWPGLRRAAKTYGRGTFRLSTDSIGRRVTYPPDRPAPEAVAIVLLVGDSFMQGVGVEDEEAVGWRLARELSGRNVLNLGVAGYGVDQMLLSVEDFLRAETARVSDIVVVAYENDFRDVQNTFDYSLARAKPAFRLRGTTLDRGRFASPLLDRLMDRSQLVWLARTRIMSHLRPPEVPPESGVDLAVACLDSIRSLGRMHSARVHIFAYRQVGPPHGRASEVSDTLWADFIRRSGAVDLTDAVRSGPGPTPIGFDGLHWSAEGNRRVARRILDILTQ